MFATYLPPLATLGSTTTVPDAERAVRVPQEILTDELVEEIKSRCCFVSNVMPDYEEDLVPPELQTGEDAMDEDEDGNGILKYCPVTQLPPPNPSFPLWSLASQNLPLKQRLQKPPS